MIPSYCEIKMNTGQWNPNLMFLDLGFCNHTETRYVILVLFSLLYKPYIFDIAQIGHPHSN